MQRSLKYGIHSNCSEFLLQSSFVSTHVNRNYLQGFLSLLLYWVFLVVYMPSHGIANSSYHVVQVSQQPTADCYLDRS